MDLRNTLFLRLSSLIQAPLVAFLGVTVEEMNDQRCLVKIPLRFRSKNPMGSMFLPALTSGADVAGSLAAYHVVRSLGKQGAVSILFTEMNAKFLKKASAHTYFLCEEVGAVRAAVEKTLATGEGVQIPLKVIAYLKERGPEQPVAQFQMTLSVKRR